MKTGIVGNIAIDHYILNTRDVERVMSDLQRQEIKVSPGQKLTVRDAKSIIDSISQPTLIRIGGGAYNSLLALLKFNSRDCFEYHDLSQKPKMPLATDPRITYFFGDSRIAHSLVLELAGERAIVKTERHDRTLQLSDFELQRLSKRVSRLDVLLVNSIANYQLAGAMQSFRGRKYIVVTKNLSLEELSESRILDQSTAIIDIEEAYILKDTSTSRTSGNMQEIIARLKRLGARRVVVTLGEDGIVYHNGNGIIKCATLPRVEEKIRKQMLFFGTRKTGAGDFFAAAIVHYAERFSFDKAALYAQMFVVKNLLNFPRIQAEDYKAYQLRGTNG